MSIVDLDEKYIGQIIKVTNVGIFYVTAVTGKDGQGYFNLPSGRWSKHQQQILDLENHEILDELNTMELRIKLP